MTTTLKIFNLYKFFIDNFSTTIPNLATLIGNFTVTANCTTALERQQLSDLQAAAGSFDEKITSNNQGIYNIKWWLHDVATYSVERRKIGTSV